MGLPPATPTPSRFLSKRPSTQQPQNDTPNPRQATGSHQFHATPRFSYASSTPRPPSTQAAHTTPALAIKSRVPKSRSTQYIIDDSSPVSLGEESPYTAPAGRTTLPEPIEFDSSLAPQSPSPELPQEGRSPKRRRISIASSESEAEPVASSQQPSPADLDSPPDATEDNDHIVSYDSDLGDEDDTHLRPAQTPASPSLSASSVAPPERTTDRSDSDLDTDPEADDAEAADPSPAPARRSNPNAPQQQKPAFNAAPRFKPPDPADQTRPHPDTSYLPDIFSPQRRGAKYLPGGLAAELRGWLVHVKGGIDGEGEVQASSAAFASASSTSASASATARVVVEEVCRGGPGLTLIAGRLVGGEEAGTGAGAGHGVVGVRAILAGEGSVEGLGGPGRDGGNRSRVVPGAVVAIVPPAWDVELDEQWTVAYRWDVVSGDGDSGG